MNRDSYDTVVAYITDNTFAMPTCISIVSLSVNAKVGELIKVYVILNDVNEDNMKKLRQLKEYDNLCVIFINLKENEILQLINRETYIPHVSKTTYYKFLLPEILQDEEKVLYIDGDTIIQNSVYELFREQIDGVYLASVNDLLLNLKNGVLKYFEIISDEWIDDIGRKCYDYFNAGVLLFNLKLMREDNLTDRLLSQLQLQKKNYYMDQDIFNLVCKDKRKMADIKYNFMCNVFDYVELDEFCELYQLEEYSSIQNLIQDMCILHLCGKFKPWSYYMPWFTEIFMGYYLQSPYSKQVINFKSPLINYNKTIKRLNMDLEQVRKENSLPQRLESGKRIILYGAGKDGHTMNFLIRKNNYCDIVMWVDRNYKELEEQFGNDEVVSPEFIKKAEYDQVLITVYDYKISRKIAEYLVDELGVTGEKIVFINE